MGSGVDFERCMADLYQNCHDPQDIKTSFEQLQLGQQVDEQTLFSVEWSLS